MEYTTIEQSKELLSYQVPEETADMFYFLDPTPAGNIYVPTIMIAEKHLKSRMPEYDKGDIPCWTLEGLFNACSLAMSKRSPRVPMRLHVWQQTSGDFCATYMDNTHDFDNLSYGSTAFEAAYNAVILHLKKRYFKCGDF